MTDPLLGIEAEEYDALCSVHELPEDKRRFVMEWMRSRDPMRAYVAAGWARTGRDPQDKGYALKQVKDDPEISAAIKVLQARRLKRFNVNRQTIEEGLARIAFFDWSRVIRIQEDGTPYFDFSEADADDMAAISEWTVKREHDPGADATAGVQVLDVKVKRLDPLRAFEALAKIHKLIGGDGALDAIHDIADAIKAGRERAKLGQR